ncbi:MAG: MBL fold metallo-hydrolase [Candidatus Zixiibacteriota bacterium]
MKSMKWYIVLILACYTCSGLVGAQDDSVYSVSKLSENIYKFETDGGGYTVKVLALVGPDGLLIVDAGEKEAGEALKKQLAQLGYGNPKIIISSHSHIEHTGGNMAFGREPLIIGHRNVRSRLMSGSYLFDEFPSEALPELEFDDSLNLRFNDEDIRMMYFGGAHDNSDIIIWFVQSKIVFVGAILNGFHFPSVDGKTGNVLEYPETVARLLAILPEDVKIIPGHGADCTMDDARKFLHMLSTSEDIVREGLASGKDKATLQEEDALKQFESYDGSYTSRDHWLTCIADGIEDAQHPKAETKDIYRPIYYAYRDEGIDAAVALYHKLKATESEEYGFDEVTSLIIGYKLYSNDKKMDAVKFFSISVEEYPEGDYAGFCYRSMGIAYKEAGNKKEAIRCLKKALEINPEHQGTKDLLEELEG